MPPVDEPDNWRKLAEELSIRLPDRFLELLAGKSVTQLAWKFLSAAEAVCFKAELDSRFDYPGREWKGIPFARSTMSEDVACFDLRTMDGTEELPSQLRGPGGR